MKKKLTISQKILFFFNLIVGCFLAIIYLIPYLEPQKFPEINLLSLVYPLFLGLNLCFVILWLLRLKPHFLFSAIIIGIGYKTMTNLYPMNKTEVLKQSDVKLLSYNVRRFNIGKWINSPTIQKEIFDFINNQHAHIICIQEHWNIKNHQIQLPFNHIKNRDANELAIYSKYKIVDSGSLDFENTANNAIYADLLIENETVRVYNVHMESFRLNIQKEHYGNENNEALLKRFKNVFIKQSEQIKKLKTHIDNCPYRTIVAGDFNNTAFSWNYHHLMENRKDAFVEAGNGFGQSFNYFIPLRIDFILPENGMDVGMFVNHEVKLSDHYPIMARIDLNN